MAFVSPVNQMIFTLSQMANYRDLEKSEIWPELNINFIKSLLEEAAKLADSEIAPLNQIGDQEGCNFSNNEVKTAPGFSKAYKKFIDSGWAGISGPSDKGGQGMPITIAVLIQELWNTSCMSFSLCPMLSQGAIEAINQHASEEIKLTYLPKLLSGEWTGTMNLTEPQAGSDVGSLNASAKKQEDGSFLIKGTKIYITYGEHDMSENIIHLVLARIEGSPEGNSGISLFLVPKFLPDENKNFNVRNDLKCIGLEKKLGIHASPTCTMSFGDNKGAIGYLIGEENRGLKCMFTMMNNARLNVGMQGVGISERSFQQALGYANERIQGKDYNSKIENNKRTEIINHPDVKRMLLEMKSLTDATRALCYDNAIAIDLGKSHTDDDIRRKNKLKADLLTPISKSWSTDIGVIVSSIGVQVHGGMGFIEETGAAQHLRDSRIAPIYEGTNGIQAIDLLTRKISLNNGEAIQNFIQEISETKDNCLKSNNSNLMQIGKNLSESLDDVKIATDKILEWLRNEDKKFEVLQNATFYLELLGIVAGGHYLARGALNNLKNDNESIKTDIAYFYCSSYLLKAKGLSKSICDGNKMINEKDFKKIVEVF